eukprot:TRINITY_DN28375_c0_g1_i1.p1 TRINITY_DN28375_c0_g1~~TRINITY_DN28375_c0_g1_i1.p1  ORF type:complete len:446 (+),score=112.01 TRINITY_DN28375_c0_g1_i1:132-1469(+)
MMAEMAARRREAGRPRLLLALPAFLAAMSWGVGAATDSDSAPEPFLKVAAAKMELDFLCNFSRPCFVPPAAAGCPAMHSCMTECLRESHEGFITCNAFSFCQLGDNCESEGRGPCCLHHCPGGPPAPSDAKKETHGNLIETSKGRDLWTRKQVLPHDSSTSLIKAAQQGDDFVYVHHEHGFDVGDMVMLGPEHGYHELRVVRYSLPGFLQLDRELEGGYIPTSRLRRIMKASWCGGMTDGRQEVPHDEPEMPQTLVVDPEAPGFSSTTLAFPLPEAGSASDGFMAPPPSFMKTRVKPTQVHTEWLPILATFFFAGGVGLIMVYHYRKKRLYSAVRQQDLDLVSELQADVEFGAGVATLTSRGKQAVQEMAMKLRFHPMVRVKVEGHAVCKCRNACTAQELSSQRAATVVMALKEHGVKNQMDSVGLGCKLKIGRTVRLVFFTDGG